MLVKQQKDFVGIIESSQQGDRRFYDLKTEYKSIQCVSEDDISDITGQQCNASRNNEDGYSSDISNSSSMLRDLNLITNKKNLKTRQVLNSNRNSMVIECDSETDLSETETQQKRQKRRIKQSRQSKQFSSNDRRAIPTIKTTDVNSEKRRSWTDSGVSLSLSRTDQSRCGTFDNGIVGSQKSSETKLDLSKAADILSENGRETNKNLSNCSTNNNTDIAVKKTNRLSQLTTQSSLTNVSRLTSNSMTSFSSIMTLSEKEYVTSDGENDTPVHDELNQRKTEIEKGSKISVSSSSTHVNGISDSRSSIETTVPADHSHAETVDVCNITKLAPTSTADPPLIVLPKATLTKQPEKVEAQRKRSKSLLSGFKKVKEHLRPRFMSDKNYKDVSSEFSFHKVNNHMSRASFSSSFMDETFDEKKEQELISPSFLDFEYEEEEFENKNNAETDIDILDKLATRPSKEKGFLGKLFKRSHSKSYFTQQKVIKKPSSNGKKQFERNNSSTRASVRSNPEGNAKDFDRHVMSMENLDRHHHHNLEYDERLCERNEPTNLSCTDLYCQCSQDMTRTRSLNHLSGESNMQRSMSIPNTPIIGRTNNYHMHGLNSIENRCSCEECMHADYLDFLEFQRYRRFITQQQACASPQQQACASPCCQPKHDQNILAPGHTSLKPEVFDEKFENIVAPLTVTIETEKQAKTFRTSKYESFV